MSHCLNLIIPAHNEEIYLPDCLAALLAQTDIQDVRLIVAVNGSTDRTAAVAEDHRDAFEAKGWTVHILDLEEGGKTRALNAAEQCADPNCPTVYLDADVLCDPELLGQLRNALNINDPRYATGTLQIRPAKSSITRHYATIWAQVPFVKAGAVGAGLFAVNPAGRSRWKAFPDIISDDTFVRLNFASSERIEMPARYHWPMVEGFDALVKVRKRQNTGVREIAEMYPDLQNNEAHTSLSGSEALKLAIRHPISFAVYFAVHIAVKFGGDSRDWTRGR